MYHMGYGRMGEKGNGSAQSRKTHSYSANTYIADTTPTCDEGWNGEGWHTSNLGWEV